MKSVLAKSFHAFTWLVVIVLVLAALLMVGPRLFGYTPYVVLSGSMQPTYPAGSLIFVEKAEPETVQVHDPITFVLNADLVVATHRVVEIDQENKYFITKGDANDAPDASPVYFKNFLGIPRFMIPKLGFVVHKVSTPPGKFLALGAIALILLAMIGYEILKPKEKTEKPTKTKSLQDFELD